MTRDFLAFVAVYYWGWTAGAEFWLAHFFVAVVAIVLVYKQQESRL